jgi:5-methylcytosine-specific restriction endonuclease McrA
MLHPVKPVTCLPEMDQILRFQRSVLELCIYVSEGNKYQKSSFTHTLGQDAGEWFWGVCESSPKSWKLYLEACIQAFKEFPDATAQVISTFDNDIQFQNHFLDSNYEFMYPSLPEGYKNSLQPLLEQFYSYFDGTGFDQKIHGSDFKLTRSKFLLSYEDITANGILYVCPICDAELSDENEENGVVDGDLDHFFPKSIFPMLSIHPYNLVPACITCNSRKHGKKNPLILEKISSDGKKTKKKNSFLDIYYPQKGRSILELGQILVSRVYPQNNLTVEIDDTNDLPHARIETAQFIYKLPTRWKSRLTKRPNVLEKIVTRMRHCSKDRKSPNIADMLTDLATERDSTATSKDAHHVLREAYITFALHNSDEQQVLFNLVYKM